MWKLNRSTFMFTRDPSHIASILFTHVKLHDSGNPTFQCRVIFTCVNEIEAMYERPRET